MNNCNSSLERKPNNPEQNSVKRQADRQTAPAVVHEALTRPGAPLDDDVRLLMESRFNHDFSQVRVHTDGVAAQSAQAVNAIAYTVGNHIAFAQGQYAPTNPPGERLLAHELAHVVQQQGAPATAQIPVGPANSPAEQQAAVAADQGFPKLTASAALVQRQQAQPQNQQVPGITTPQPANVQVNPNGTTTQTINGLEVIFQPDRQSAAKDMRNRAETNFNFARFSINYQSQGGVVTSFTGPGQPRVTIQTTYGQGVTSASTSGYGRGTSQADVQAGQTTLGFHEGRHGLDYLTFFQQNVFPQFTGRVGMSVADFTAAMQSYRTERTQYAQNLRRFSEQQTDCVGTTIDQFNAQQGTLTAVCQVTP